MSSGASDASGSNGGRLGGARADFVASLGRKVSDTRGLLSVLDDDPSSKPARDELRRRLHALCSGARLLHFVAMAHSLSEALAVLDRAAQLGELGETEIAFTAQVLDDLPALAWGDGPGRELGAHPPVDAQNARSQLPMAVLVVGGASLAEPLTGDRAIRTRSFECERTEDIDTALQLARAYAPDLALVDADLARAPDLIEALLDDPLTEPVPIIVVGTFGIPEEAARFNVLGVARVLAKPISADKIRATCEEILDAREGRTLRMTLGEPTLEQLATRLADELKRALLDSVDAPARACRVPLGEGTEVLGALWGAIARVQEIIAQKTEGAIRFGGDAPEGAIALAPWLHHDVGGYDRLSGRVRGAAADVRMNGRRVVVADDDPGVTWFISDLLRTAGCEVFEALDGVTALELAYRMQPELVVSDILMPGLDGFGLSRALRRDVALRGTPVILLSWKEDLLQRVRELGASAAAYMRKETDSRAILARVREVLRPRARIEMRIRGAGEVRGRLDELSPRLLLDLVCIVRKDARVAVRDASFLYEIDIRGGTPRKATRTTSDGGYQSGERALTSLLGVGAGRFVVSSTHEPIRGDLSGTLFEQLSGPIASARGALAAISGAGAMQVDRIGFDRASLDEYLRATPDPARSLLRRIAEGSSPRQMILAGDVSPSLLEDILADLAARGAIRSVNGADGADLLTPAVETALAIARGPIARSAGGLPANARPSVPLPSTTASARTAADPAAPPPPVYETLRLTDPPPPARDEEDDGGIPSSLEDAVMREISDRSPNPGPAHASAPQLPPIVEPSQLRPRSSNPPSLDGTDDDALLASIPPDAIVPDAVGTDGAPPAGTAAAPLHGNEVRGSGASPPAEGNAGPMGGSSSADGPFVSPFALPTTPTPEEPLREVTGARPLASKPAGPKPAEPKVVVASEPGSPPPDSDLASPMLPRKSPRTWAKVMAFLLVIVAAGAAIYIADSQGQPTLGSSVRPAPIPPVTASESASTLNADRASPPSVPRNEGDEPPAGVDVPAGSGYLEVLAAPGASVRVDGIWVGAGPTASRVVVAGYHEVTVEQGGHDSKQVIEVRAAKTTRVRSASIP
jgi:DNA-binding response OmpR family regulator